MKTVAFVSRVLTHYRIPFFNQLRQLLEAEGIALKVIYGQGSGEDRMKSDSGELKWAQRIRNIYLPLGFVWQPCFRYIRDADLIITEQANRLLLNYFLMVRRFFSPRKLAFHGHGRNLQLHPSRAANRIKRIYSCNCDWWFCYTEGSRRIVKSYGYPEERITVSYNAVDTKSCIKMRESIPRGAVAALREKLGIDKGPIGIYCGSLYKEKRLDFLLDSFEKIAGKVPGFSLIVIGAGPEQNKVASAAASGKNIRYVGPKFDAEKASYFMLADVFLMPGLVGLAILDSFSFQVPLITTDWPYHSPEIEYLENGVNGLISADTTEAYAGAVTGLLADPQRLAEMKRKCLESASAYSIETMAGSFTKGISRCLRNP